MQISVPNQIPLTRHLPAMRLAGLLLSLFVTIPKAVFIADGINGLSAHSEA
jgi:hypothetical protein